MDPNDCCTRTDGHTDDRSPHQRALDDADAAITAAERNLLAANDECARADAAFNAARDAVHAAYNTWAALHTA